MTLIPTDWTSTLANHLWQSTTLVAVAWLLAFALRNNQARTRYWIWLLASLKFLLPFAPLIDAGRRLGSIFAAPLANSASSSMALSSVMEQITLPFPQSAKLVAAPIAASHHGELLPILLLTAWGVGAITIVSAWGRQWWRIRTAVRTATQRSLAAEVPVLSTSSLLEPGVFGIIQPVLLLPDGIADRLTQAQLETIVAHEMCHVRRRDNLTYALHMIVETLFWFHPLVWWIRARLIEERERACDEAVLHEGSEAQVYAEGILNVCKFYVESPLACVSGVTGSDLKKRIVRIMTQRFVDKLSLGRKLLLVAIGFAVVTGPLVIGFAKAAPASGQDSQSQDSKSQDPQSATTPPPSFEVATIKPNRSGENKRVLFMSPGKFNMTGMPVKELIRFAYDLKSDAQLSGGPGWLASDMFDIEAKEDEAQVQALNKLPPEQVAGQVRLMVQALLAERFNLKVSHETKELPVYALVVAKNGPKLTPATAPPMIPPGDKPPGSGPAKGPGMRGIRMEGNGQLTGIATPTALLANILSRQQELGNRLVLDKTGLTGSYDWTLKWTPANTNPSLNADAAAPPNAPAGDSSAPSLFTALQEQLGLKLEPQKGLVEIVAIDHIDPPSAN